MSLVTECPWPTSAMAPGDICTGAAGNDGVQKAGSRSWNCTTRFRNTISKIIRAMRAGRRVSETEVVPLSLQTHPWHGLLQEQRVVEGSG